VQEEVSEKITEVVKENIWGNIKRALDWGFHFGEGDDKIHITVGLLLIFTVSVIITRFLLRWLNYLFTRKMDEVDSLKFTSFFKFIKYIIYVIVVFSVLSIAGVNITPFLTASAAILVGVGLALQEIFQDVIGGILIMIDKSLLVGDIIEIDKRVGRVMDIKLRTTRAITRDDKILIIPNHKFISDSILNYTQNHKTTRESVQVGVAYGSDTNKVKQLLVESVMEDHRILTNPAPFVSFEDFGDSSLVFRIYFFISDSFIDPNIKSDIRFKIDTLFRKNNITIPFPQREVHIHQKNKIKKIEQ